MSAMCRQTTEHRRTERHAQHGESASVSQSRCCHAFAARWRIPHDDLRFIERLRMEMCLEPDEMARLQSEAR